MRHVACIAVAVVALSLGCHRAPPPLRVAAAADMAQVLDALGAAFAQRTGCAISPTVGASGVLARQIEEGAPFDVFVSANTTFVDRLIAGGHARAATRVRFARGRVVAWTAPGASPLPSLQALVGPEYRRIAIANPEHAPYGEAAVAALQRAGVWHAVQDKLVRGENVQVALRFAQTGNADVALVARGLVMNAPGNALLVDTVPEQPLDQSAVVVTQAHDAASAKAFVDFLGSPEGQSILRQYGFEAPSGSPAQSL